MYLCWLSIDEDVNLLAEKSSRSEFCLLRVDKTLFSLFSYVFKYSKHSRFISHNSSFFLCFIVDFLFILYPVFSPTFIQYTHCILFIYSSHPLSLSSLPLFFRSPLCRVFDFICLSLAIFPSSSSFLFFNKKSSLCFVKVLEILLYYIIFQAISQFKSENLYY